MFKNVTLRLPAKLSVRIARAARQKGQSTRRWMQEAIEHEVERRERFIAYVKQAQNADPAQGPVEEIEARSRLRFWLDHLSPEKRVARSTSRRLR